MDALEESASKGSYTGGLFWLQHPNIPVFDRVQRLLERARKNNVRTEVLEVPTFDELMGDIFRQLDHVTIEIDAMVNKVRKRISGVTRPLSPDVLGRSFRLNALHVVAYPSICRRIGCEIGGHRECEEAAKGSPVLVARRDIGVLAFGADSDLRRCFESYNIRDFDLHSIEFGRLRYDSAEHGLLNAALGRGLRTRTT